MPLIELRYVSKYYQMGEETVKALDGASFSIYEGDYVGILGPSGSGKSTLMHLLGFLDSPSSGEILFDGRSVANISPNERASIRSEKIGFVFQSFNLLPRLTVLQNVLLPLSYSSHRPKNEVARAREALNAVGLAGRINHRPGQLSGGQRQRVAIARALINNPRMILADEPTGNLDSSTAETIIELFERLNAEENRTILLVTHDPKIAQRCRRRIEVLDGRIVGDTLTHRP